MTETETRLTMIKFENVEELSWEGGKDNIIEIQKSKNSDQRMALYHKEGRTYTMPIDIADYILVLQDAYTKSRG